MTATIKQIIVEFESGSTVTFAGRPTLLEQALDVLTSDLTDEPVTHVERKPNQPHLGIT